MPSLFEKAFEKARRLPDDERETIGQIILDELRDEAAWQHKFAESREALDKLAAKAIEADERGETTPLVFSPYE